MACTFLQEVNETSRSSNDNLNSALETPRLPAFGRASEHASVAHRHTLPKVIRHLESE